MSSKEPTSSGKAAMTPEKNRIGDEETKAPAAMGRPEPSHSSAKGRHEMILLEATCDMHLLHEVGEAVQNDPAFKKKAREDFGVFNVEMNEDGAVDIDGMIQMEDIPEFAHTKETQQGLRLLKQGQDKGKASCVFTQENTTPVVLLHAMLHAQKSGKDLQKVLQTTTVHEQNYHGKAIHRVMAEEVGEPVW